jgi:DNA-binding transcriptional MerR regulator
MMRIGEAARQFNISNRTLRYWEQMGILNSTRTENNYRFYDNENAARIRYIVLLRKLNMPIADIERIFITADFNVAIDALNRHLKNLKNEAAYNGILILLIESLIQQMKGFQNLEQVFSFLELHTTAQPNLNNMPQNLSPERIMLMAEKRLENVRIVRLPVMTVASYRAESDSPEMDCFNITNKFILENNLHKRAGFRHFGFNNPIPTEGNPVYGYENWVVIPDDFTVPPLLVKKKIESALYASIPTSMSEIGERGWLLHEWIVKNDEYEADVHFQQVAGITAYLEECIDFETFIAAFENPQIKQQLDIMAPVKRK